MFSSENKIVVGARKSKLSLAQVKEVECEIQKFHPEISFEVISVHTTGDLDLTTSLRDLDKTDFFTREIDQLLLQGKCRIAVHSAKDLPEPICPGLKVVAITQGVDSGDSLVLREGETLQGLPLETKIGTSSRRREQNILALRPDLTCVDIRGTIERRLEILQEGKVDGVIVAEAALIRLGLTRLNRIKLTGETAPLQGKLAVVSRDDDHEMEGLFCSLASPLS
jgi:hydroxymethylbilane synthase